ncbi:MAG TPA: DUF4932 domain-containing protein [Verrucomicrobiae bacterium]|nr:DUF4932 domain-containing protein [Verrucomicrobiae bacterium]
MKSLPRDLALLCLCCFPGLGLFAGQSTPSGPSVAPHVDQRVELFSIVFRLAGNSEYHMDTLPTYSADIDRYFAPYKNHPAVQMAHALAEKNDLGFDGVMWMAISLSPPPQLVPLIPFTTDSVDKRWGVADTDKFLPLLRDFWRDSKFAEFYAAHQSMYRMAEDRFSTTLEAVDFGWYQRFYGNAPDLTYHLILGMNNGGGNYGPRLVHPDGRIELFSIMGCWTHDDAGKPTYPPDQGYLPTIIHEFNHSFVNPVVAEHWKEFSGAEQVFDTVNSKMKRMAYDNAQTMVNESLVRAAVIVYFQDAGEDGRKNLTRIREEQRHGFFWMDQLVDKLKQYEAARAHYPTFNSYIPQTALFYRDLAPHAAEEATVFEAKCPHVASMQPFANQAQDVDPSLKTITIVVDKPLDPSGYSINKGADGDEHFPIAGKPTFEAGGLHIVLPVQLKANQTYSFVLTPQGFATPDGYPLISYKVEFKTKSWK